jgi:hypothetical protein
MPGLTLIAAGIPCPAMGTGTHDVAIRQESAVPRRPDLLNIAFLDQSCLVKPTVEMLVSA